MGPYYDEERLRNQVIYLHSLWHQGPPNPRSCNIPYNPRPYSLIRQFSVNLNPRLPNPLVSVHHGPLQPVNSSTFENKKRKKKKAIKKRDRKKRTRVDPHMNSGPEWPMPAQDSAPVASEWPPLEPRPTQATRPLSAEEEEKLKALQVQYKARQACREFLFDYDDSDDDDVEDDEDIMDDDDDAQDIGEFFSKLFGEKNELKNYYEKCWKSGEFRCLICAVADHKNAGKRFHDCVGLVQHSMSISRTKNKRAHRAFGNAVCNVLGWNINGLPTIAIKNDVKPAVAEGKTNDNAASGKDDSLSSDKLDNVVSVEQLGEPVKHDVEVVHETIKRVSELLAPTQDSAPVVSEWPPLEPHPTQQPRPLSAEEEEILKALQVQYKARQACREFLLGSDDSDGEDVDDDEDDMDDDEAQEIGEFFSKLIGENNELRNYYKKCWESGEFRCLVCAVADHKNAGKRFHDCVGLVRHSMSISRTKNIRAHRAFGNTVCNVLGWDINRLPTIVIKNEVKPADAEGKTNDNAADGKDDSISSDKLDDEVSVEQLGEPVKQDVEVVHETMEQVSELLAPAQDSAPALVDPPMEPCPAKGIRSLSAEEKEILEALQVQYKARQACREFLFGSDDSDGDGDNDGVDDDEDDMDDDDEVEEMGEFFLKLLGENNELTKYYKKCWESGEFRCLVCAVADNKNAGKRFHDCVGLVQHSMSISRTKYKRAHRAFGNSVCNVLGWDINRLPTIVIKNDVNPAEAKENANENDGDGKDGSLSSDKLDDEVSVEQLAEPIRQGVEVVHETIKQVNEGEPDKSADDQGNGASNQNSKEDHDIHP